MPIFKIDNAKAKQIKAAYFKSEKELQTLVEANLEEFFGIKFIKSEHVTGERHGGRIDTLGLDENNTPVVFEYKWGEKENIINQGLFYLDWLIDHKGDFQVLVESKLDKKIKIDWAQPRLILLAASFSKYDMYAINRMAENIELWTYSYYENGLLEIRTEANTHIPVKKSKKVITGDERYNLDYHLKKTVKELQKKFEEIRDKIIELPNVTEKVEQRSGITYRTTKSFTRFEFKKSYIQILLKKPNYKDPKKLMKDITSFEWGYKGMVKMEQKSDIDYVFRLVKQSYEDTL